LFDYNPTGNTESEGFFVCGVGKTLWQLVSIIVLVGVALFLLGVHLNWQFPAVTA
jgi:hypothetical protein